MGLAGWRSGPAAAEREYPRGSVTVLTAQPFVKRDLSCSRNGSVPFPARNETVAPIGARFFGAIKRESETMPGTENGTVAIASQRSATKRPMLRVVGEPAAPPRRKRNAERRPREYLTPAEVETLIATAKKRGRYGHRDVTTILIAYRHGLRVGELCALRWDQVDFGQGLLHVTRLKHGVPSVHPHMLRHACGFKLANDGQDTRALQHYLGHRNIQHTVRYTELAADRVKGFRQD
jgi:integrase